MFPLALVEKDFRYAVAQAESTGAQAPLTRHALDVFARACALGYDAENINAVVKLFEQGQSQ